MLKTTASQLRANFLSKRDPAKTLLEDEDQCVPSQTRSEMLTPRMDKLESLSQNNRKNKLKIIKQSEDQSSKQERIK